MTRELKAHGDSAHKDHADRTRAHLRTTEVLTDDDGAPVLDADGAKIEVDAGYEVPDDDLTDLERVEREHGFTFGVPSDHETDAEPEVARIACSNPDCPQVNRLVTVFADTLQPVRCGSCYSVLYCEHDPQEVVTTGGTIGAPTRTTQSVCTKCDTVITETVEQLPPIDLNTLPAAILDTPL